MLHQAIYDTSGVLIQTSMLQSDNYSNVNNSIHTHHLITSCSRICFFKTAKSNISVTIVSMLLEFVLCSLEHTNPAAAVFQVCTAFEEDTNT